MAKVHDRILEITFTADLSADTVAIASVKYYRDRSYTTGFNIPIDTTAAQASALPPEVAVDEVFPPPTHIRLIPTIQA